MDGGGVVSKDVVVVEVRHPDRPEDPGMRLEMIQGVYLRPVSWEEGAPGVWLPLKYWEEWVQAQVQAAISRGREGA